MQKVKVGSARKINGQYVITSEYADIGGNYGTFFKDSEAYENDWDAPCYSEEACFDDAATTDRYWTHVSFFWSVGITRSCAMLCLANLPGNVQIHGLMSWMKRITLTIGLG